MFSGIVFAQDQTAAGAIERTAAATEQVRIYKIMLALASHYEVTRALNAFKPDILFLELTSWDQALRTARNARANSPDTAIVGFVSSADEKHERMAREAGVAAILCPPLPPQEFQEVIERAIRTTRASIQQNLLAFLPSKAGSGATTVALNAAAALARDCGQRVLVIEADLRSGPISILLKLNPQHSILEALNSADNLDATLLNSLVVKSQGVDILPTSRPTGSAMVSWSAYHQLLELAGPHYDCIVVDMPEVINEALFEVVRRARGVHIVTTPELPSLVLARHRRRELNVRGIEDQRIAVVLNRWGSADIDVQDVEELLEHKVSVLFHNDYPAVRRAVQQARVLGAKSELGRAFSAFASRLSGVQVPVESKFGLSFLNSLLPRKEYVLRLEPGRTR